MHRAIFSLFVFCPHFPLPLAISGLESAFWAASLKGTKSCRIQGESVCLYVCMYGWTNSFSILYGWMDRWMDRQTDSSCVLQDFVSFWAAALLPLNLNHKQACCTYCLLAAINIMALNQAIQNSNQPFQAKNQPFQAKNQPSQA